MDLLIRMVEHHIWLIGEMVDRAATLDDETLDATIISVGWTSTTTPRALACCPG